MDIGGLTTFTDGTLLMIIRLLGFMVWFHSHFLLNITRLAIRLLALQLVNLKLPQNALVFIFPWYAREISNCEYVPNALFHRSTLTIQSTHFN